MRKNVLKWLVLFFVPLLLLFLNSESIKISKADQAVIQNFSSVWHLPTTKDSIHQNFESEVKFIAAVQNGILSTITHKEIKHEYFGNLHYYFENKEGFCYDRAVTLEKFLSHYGFPYRHVYLYFGKSGETPSTLSLFQKGVSSHALLEVKTCKGWMALGTNANWLGVTVSNDVLDTRELRRKITEKNAALKYTITIGQCFWQEKGDQFRIVYGLFSRHGDFFSRHGDEKSMLFSKPFHLLPDYNLRMLLYNL